MSKLLLWNSDPRAPCVTTTARTDCRLDVRGSCPEPRRRTSIRFGRGGPAPDRRRARALRRCHRGQAVTEGPLATLPSYRSLSTGHVSRAFPFVLPPKLHTGKGMSEAQAYLSAGFEMAERIQPRPSTGSSLSTWRGHRSWAATPSTSPRFLACAVSSSPGTTSIEDDPVTDWVEGTSLVTGASVLVPASMVFFPQPRFRGLFKPQWSGGLAAGSTLEEAGSPGALRTSRARRLGRVAAQPRTVRRDRHADDLGRRGRALARRCKGGGLPGPDPGSPDGRRHPHVPRMARPTRRPPSVRMSRRWGASRQPDRSEARPHGGATQARVHRTEELGGAASLPSSRLFQSERSLYHLSGLTPFELPTIPPTVDFAQIPSGSTGVIASDTVAAAERIRRAVPGCDIVVIDFTTPWVGIPTVRVIATGLQEMAKPWLYVQPRTFELPVRMGRRPRSLAYDELYCGEFPH